MTVSETQIEAATAEISPMLDALLEEHRRSLTISEVQTIARACLTAALSDQAGGWRTISTAQRSSAVELMVYDAHSGIIHQATWKEPFGGFATGGWYDMPFTGDGRRLARPTHWQPLPAPPPSSTAGEAEGG